MITYAFDYLWFQVQTNSTYQQVLKWLATAIVVTAAYLFTVYPELGLESWLLAMFLIGHIIWTVFAAIMKDWALFGLNLAFVPIDLYGVIIRL